VGKFKFSKLEFGKMKRNWFHYSLTCRQTYIPDHRTALVPSSNCPMLAAVICRCDT